MIFACHSAMCDTTRRSSVVWQNAKSPPVSTVASRADTRVSALMGIMLSVTE
jgi:hypothetical protein